jgi:hypothetical protein
MTPEQAAEALARGKLDILAARIKSLNPPNRLRLAAELLEAQKPRMALAVARQVADELQLVLAEQSREPMGLLAK